MNSRKEILLVDDDLDHLKYISHFLTGANYAVSLASTPVEALELAKRKKIDLAILDVSMPEMGAPELASLIQSSGLNYRVPVVLISGGKNHDTNFQHYPFRAHFFCLKENLKENLLPKLDTLFSARS